MASPTNTYADYATGNDYKGTSFTDGAYTSATKTLVKASAFAASKVNHWLYLSDNGSGNIVDGYYKIATWTDANTVILATDAGGGSDATDVVCTQAAGTTGAPWRSVQGALDLITRDATNGDQINVKAGTAQVLQAALTLATYGTTTEGAPLVIRGYTSVANDGGMGEIDCNGASMWAANNYGYIDFADLTIHNFGNNTGINCSGGGGFWTLYHCKVHKGTSSPSGKALILGVGGRTKVIGCHIYNANTTGIGISQIGLALNNYVYNCPTGLNNISDAIHNVVVDCAIGIEAGGDAKNIVGNSIYISTASTGSGISAASGNADVAVLNNIIEGYSGAGGKGISAIADLAIYGYNAFYNCATGKSVADVYLDLGNDATLSASPFTNAAGGDFSLATGVAGAIDGAFPGAWYGPASTTDHADIGAVQNGAGASGGLLRHPGMSGGIDG